MAKRKEPVERAKNGDNGKRHRARGYERCCCDDYDVSHGKEQGALPYLVRSASCSPNISWPVSSSVLLSGNGQVGANRAQGAEAHYFSLGPNGNAKQLSMF